MALDNHTMLVSGLGAVLRKSARGRQMLLIALSGWERPQDKQQALEAGFDSHLTKPASVEAIEALLASGEANSVR